MRLRDLKNTVIVVEHDEEAIRKADYVIDMGPGAGDAGGQVVAAGKISKIIQRRHSANVITVKGARGNNLKRRHVIVG